MSVPVTQFQVLRLMLQIEQNSNGLQRDLRSNAASWKASAQAQAVAPATLAQYMSDAVSAYQTRLAWLTTVQADSAHWPKVVALWTILGGTDADFTALMTPLTAEVNQLGLADKSNYAKIIAICDQVLSAIDAPLSLWPE